MPTRDDTDQDVRLASPIGHVVLALVVRKFLYILKAGLRAAACGGRPRPASPPAEEDW
jgi:hypothetical protein